MNSATYNNDLPGKICSLVYNGTDVREQPTTYWLKVGSMKWNPYILALLQRPWPQGKIIYGLWERIWYYYSIKRTQHQNNKKNPYLMVYCYTHRSVYLSIFIRQTSSYSRYRLTQRLVNMQRIRHFGMLDTKWGIDIHPSFQGSGIFSEGMKRL